MPNTKSATRSIKKVKKQTSVNKIRKSKYKSIIKEISLLITAKKKKEAIKLLPELNSQLMKTAKVGIIKKQTVSAAAEIIKLKGATFYAPASSTTNIVESIYLDKKSIIPCSTYLIGEYGVKDVCIGVPVKIGKEGIEDIIEIELNKTERNQFMKGVNYLKDIIKSINN